MAIHKWKPEEIMAVNKETVSLVSNLDKLPEGIKLCASWVAGPQRYFCLWEAPSKEALEKMFEEYASVVSKGTEVLPVVQSYPPTVEFEIVLMQQMIEMASK